MRFRLLAVLATLATGAWAAPACGTHWNDMGHDCTPEERQRFGCEGCPYTCDRDAGADADAGDAGEDAGDATMDEEDAGDGG